MDGLNWKILVEMDLGVPKMDGLVSDMPGMTWHCGTTPFPAACSELRGTPRRPGRCLTCQTWHDLARPPSLHKELRLGRWCQVHHTATMVCHAATMVHHAVALVSHAAALVRHTRLDHRLHLHLCKVGSHRWVIALHS